MYYVCTSPEEKWKATIIRIFEVAFLVKNLPGAR